MNHLTDFERGAMEMALRRMFEPGAYLSIVTLDQMLKVAKVLPPAHEYQAMRLLHCVDWKAMPPDIRSQAVRIILSWFALPAFDPFAPPPPALVEQKTTLRVRLLSWGRR